MSEEAETKDVLCPVCSSAVHKEEIVRDVFDCDDCNPPRRLIATLTNRICLACAHEWFIKPPEMTRARVLANHRLHHRIDRRSRELIGIRDLAVGAVECFNLVIGLRGSRPDRPSNLKYLDNLHLKALADAARRIAHQGKAAEALILSRKQASDEAHVALEELERED